MSDRADAIKGLRELASFLEQHPVVPMPACIDQLNSFVGTKEEMAEIARATSWNKHFNESWFYLERTFSGEVGLHINIVRSEVCRQVVVGQRTEPAKPATPERVVDVIEWQCDEPLLAGHRPTEARSI